VTPSLSLCRLIALALTVGVVQDLRPQSFEEVSSDAGIVQTYQASNLMGGGLAWFDYDMDGLEDVYLVAGHQQDQLFKNNGDGTFTNATTSAGYLIETISRNTTGVVTGDIDNDGFREIFVTTWNTSFSPVFQRNLLFYNNGDGTFTEIGESANLDEEKLAMAACFVDLNLDGYLDLYVGNYISQASVIYDNNNDVIGFDHQCFDDDVYINNGDLTFTHADGNGNYGDNNEGCTLAMAASDFDRDGDQDVLFVNDFGDWIVPNTLLQNDHPANNLSDVSESSGFGIGIYGMGVAIGDYDEDQDLDYYFTNIGSNALMRNDDLSSFTNVSEEAQVEDEYYGSGFAVGWGTFFFDYNNDSYLDLFVNNGYIDAVDWLSNVTLQNNSLFRGSADGIFDSVGDIELPSNPYRSRGCAYADYDGDGDLDFGVMSVFNFMDFANDKFALYENLGNDNNWISFKLEGMLCNKDAYGSIVELHAGDRTFIREVTSGSSYSSQNSSIVHFGLGDIEEVDSAVVVWPGGEAKTISSLSINTFSYLQQDTAIWMPPDTTNQDTTYKDSTAKDTIDTDTLVTWLQSRSRNKIQFNLFPNPVKDQLNAEFRIPRQGIAVIRLYDLTGRHVWTFHEGEVNEERHTMTFEIPFHLGSGSYLCVLTSDGYRRSQLINFTRD
jgi:hypothetical protein